MGWFFLHAGWGKVLGEFRHGFGSFYQSSGFQSRNPGFIPDFIVAPYGYLLPWAELIFGVLLLIGFLHRIATGAILFMLVTIAIGLLSAGDLFPRHLVMVFIPMALVLFLQGPGAWNTDKYLRLRKQ